MGATVISDETPRSTELVVVEYKDRAKGLIVLGTLQIVVGVLAALMIPLMFFVSALSHETPGPRASAGVRTSATVIYVGVAVALVALGAGAIRARRWAWALNLILAWSWLLTGIVATPAFAFMILKDGATGAWPLAMFVWVLFQVLAPLEAVRFYRSRDVELTCKQRDPMERWTDRRPLPVTAFVLWTGLGIVLGLAAIFTDPRFAFFGRYLTGWPAIALTLAQAALDAFVVVALLRMRPIGWWVAVSVAITLAISHVLTTVRTGDIAQHSGVVMFSIGAVTVAPLVFLLWLGRYFLVHRIDYT